MLRWVAALVAIAGCKKAASTETDDKPVPEQGVTCAKASHATGSIRWIEDDFEAAVTCATERKQPIVIDMWAPWCHTCLSMQTQIFPDPAFAPLADRFVWLALDTDREVNALPVAAYPPAAWPTFFVISPSGELQGRFVGAGSIDQIREFLTEGEKAFLDGEDLPPDQPLALVRAGDRAITTARSMPSAHPDRDRTLASAEAAYDQALAKAPADWPRRPDVLVSALGVRRARGAYQACVDFALAHVGETGRAASATDFLGGAMTCAEERAAEAPDHAKQLYAAAATRLEQVVADATAPLSADDRSDAMMYLRQAYDALGRPADAQAMAERQRVLLDEAAAAADTPLAASTYNWPRAEVYVYLNRHAEILPALEKSAADLPKDYDPPYRLAWVHLQAKQYDQAQAWIEKAIALVYGPRKARAQQMLVDILQAKGATEAELAARASLIATYEALPPEMAKPAELEKARAQLVVRIEETK